MALKIVEFFKIYLGIRSDVRVANALQPIYMFTILTVYLVLSWVLVSLGHHQFIPNSREGRGRFCYLPSCTRL